MHEDIDPDELNYLLHVTFTGVRVGGTYVNKSMISYCLWTDLTEITCYFSMIPVLGIVFFH